MKIQELSTQIANSTSTSNDDPEFKEVNKKNIANAQSLNTEKTYKRFKKEKIPQMVDEVLSNLNPDVLKNKSLLLEPQEQTPIKLPLNDDRPISIGPEIILSSKLLESDFPKKKSSQRPNYSAALFSGFTPKIKNKSKDISANPYSTKKSSLKRILEKSKPNTLKNPAYDPKDILKEMLIKRAREKNENLISEKDDFNEWYEVDESSQKEQKKKNRANGKPEYEETIWFEENGTKKLKTS